jgi:hypothetical protein
MPVLDIKMFAGDGELDPDEAAKLEIKNTSSDVNTCLSEFGWKDGAASCISLTLSADNRKVDRGAFIMTGGLASSRKTPPGYGTAETRE